MVNLSVKLVSEVLQSSTTLRIHYSNTKLKGSEPERSNPLPLQFTD